MLTPLTPERIAKGIERCVITANDLFNSAMILDCGQQKAVAHSLAVHAYEEFGKIGWLFRAVIIPYKRSGKMWKYFWEKYKDHGHKIKIGVTLRQRTTTGFLIPGIEFIFDSDNPLMPMHPITFNELRKIMLYLDFDKNKKEFLGPRDRFGSNINNEYLLHEHLAILASYVAFNNAKNVFHPAVLKLYNEIVCACSSHSEWNNYIRLFYKRIFKSKSGFSVEIEEKEVNEELKNIDAKRFAKYSQKIIALSNLTPDNIAVPPLLKGYGF